MDIVELLKKCAYFSGLSEEHRRELAGLCRPRKVAKQDYLFLEGREGNEIFILAAGSVQLVKNTADGKSIVIRTIEPGEAFGEVILFEQHTYPVTAMALRDSEVCGLARGDLLRLLADEAFRNDFIAFLMGRLRYLADRILYLTSCDVDERFFRFLKEQYGEKDVYRLTMSKKDIAAAIGTTPETFSRLMQRLTKAGTLEVDGKTIKLSRTPGSDVKCQN